MRPNLSLITNQTTRKKAGKRADCKKWSKLRKKFTKAVLYFAAIRHKFECAKSLEKREKLFAFEVELLIVAGSGNETWK